MFRLAVTFILAATAWPALAQSSVLDIRERGHKVGEIRYSADGQRATEYRAGHRGWRNPVQQ